MCDRSPFIFFGKSLTVFLAIAASALILLASISRADERPTAAQTPGRAGSRPNVILLLTDDQGYGDLSCNGNPVLKTPNVDRLASQSVRFTDFHVAPMCTPTRAQLMTGVDALRSAAMNVSSGRTLLRTDLPTMGDIFAANGYRTAMFGKWHLGDNYPYRPIDRGFQKAIWFRSSYIGSASDVWNNDYFNDRYFEDGSLRQFEGYSTDVFFKEATQWLQERRRGGEPFFLYLPLNAAHSPLLVPERYRRQYETLLADKNLPKQRRDSLARFFGMIANIDETLGRLESVLTDTGLRENTIFIFMTDNGGTAGVPFYNAGMKGEKKTLWEGGHRVPCFVRWPAGGIGKGRDVKALTECQDVLPTLVDLCKLTLPKNAAFDGVSLADLLTGKADELPDRALVVQFSRMDAPRPRKNDAAVLWRQWRMRQGKELYDLSTDPHQDKNVIDRHPDIAARMQKHYDAFWASVEPSLDHFQPSVVGSEKENPTRLCACDWADVFLDQGGQVRRGEPKNGLWHIDVRQAGRYEISLCRWPREANLAIRQSAPPHQGEDIIYPTGVALPIAQARLRVGDRDLKCPVAADDREARFTLELPQGRTTLQTYFYDDAGKELAGAYYVYVYRQTAEDHPAVTIVANGKSDWRIECVAKDNPAVRWAATELQTYLRRISRCELPLVDSPSAGPAIVVGRRKDFSAKDQTLLPALPQGYDGYAVAVHAANESEPPRILIAGENERGTIYGGYDLLERFGCRWFYPTLDPHDPEVVPEQSSLSLPVGNWAVASPFRFRICGADSWIYEMDYQGAAKQLDWAMKNRYNNMAWGPESKTSLIEQYQRMKDHGLLDELSKRGMSLSGPGHSFDYLLKTEDYMAAHPEWFGMRDGKRVPQTILGAQFCWSNREARKQFVENAVAFAAACPEISILSLMPFDGGISCDCPECRKAGASNLLMTLMGEVTQRLKQAKPELIVETLGGYGNVTTPPDNAKIHPQQRILWAHWGRYHGTPYDDPRYDKTNLELWHRAAPGGLTVGQYYGDNFCEPWIMPPFALAIEGDRRYLLEKKIDSEFVLLWPPGYWWNHGLNGYLAGRCFYDVSLDPYQELRDYAKHYFGPEAGPALADYYDQWARQIDLAYHVRGGATEKDVAMLVDQRAKWLDPAVKTAKSNALYSYRVSKVEKLHTLAEQMAQASCQNDELIRLHKEGRLEEARKCLVQLQSTTDQILKLAHVYAGLNQGLIDGKLFDAFVAPPLKARVEEQAKTLANRNKE